MAPRGAECAALPAVRACSSSLSPWEAFTTNEHEQCARQDVGIVGIPIHNLPRAQGTRHRKKKCLSARACLPLFADAWHLTWHCPELWMVRSLLSRVQACQALGIEAIVTSTSMPHSAPQMTFRLVHVPGPCARLGTVKGAHRSTTKCFTAQAVRALTQCSRTASQVVRPISIRAPGLARSAAAVPIGLRSLNNRSLKLGKASQASRRVHRASKPQPAGLQWPRSHA